MKSLRDLFSFDRGEKTIRKDQGGLIGTTGMIIIAAIAGVLGIGAASTLDWTFIVATMMMAVIALTIVGTIWFGVPFNRVIIMSMICLGIVTFLEIGVLPAAGLIVVGGTFYRFNPVGNQQIWFFLALIGVGLLAVIWGAEFGMIDGFQEGLQTIVP